MWDRYGVDTRVMRVEPAAFLRRLQAGLHLPLHHVAVLAEHDGERAVRVHRDARACEPSSSAR